MHTQNPEQITSETDIVVTYVGIPNNARGDWIKKGVVVIDTGTNQVKVTSKKKNYLNIFKFPLASECIEVLEEVSFMTEIIDSTW
jgi:5,10-methylene-tetrahydrofolate dehydrogenase/methenyl tetrahydrofolate cyclohydrolase